MSIIDKSIQIFEKSNFLKTKLGYLGLKPEDLMAAQEYCQPYVQLAKSISSSHNSVIQAEKEKRNVFQYLEFVLDCSLHVDKFFNALERRKPQTYVESLDEKFDRMLENTYGHTFRYIDDYIHQYFRTSDNFKLVKTLEYGGQLYVEVKDVNNKQIVLRTSLPERNNIFELSSSFSSYDFSLREFKGIYDYFYFPSREYLNEVFRPTFHTWFMEQLQGQNLKFAEKHGYLKLLSDDVEEPTVETQQAKEFATIISKYFQQNFNRSYLFYGPPGSGKSNLMRGIAGELKLPYLRLDKSSLLHHNDIISILNEIKVSCVLIDDIDWMDKRGGMQQLLDLLGQLNSMVKLVLGSANYIAKLPGALKRPERFDRTFLIQFLDQEVHLQMVQQDRDIFNITQNWPAVYIKEFMKRVKAEGKEKALSEMSDLQERVDELLKDNYSNSSKLETPSKIDEDLEEDGDEEDDEDTEENCAD